MSTVKKRQTLHIHCDICSITATYKLTGASDELIQAHATYYPYPIFFHHKDHYLLAYIDKSRKCARETLAIPFKIQVNPCQDTPKCDDGFEFKLKKIKLLFAKDEAYKSLQQYASNLEPDKKVPIFIEHEGNYWLVYLHKDLSVISMTHSTLLLDIDHQ